MKKIISILMLLILCVFFSNTVFASSSNSEQVSNQATDTIFRFQIEKSLNQLRRNQNRMRQDYKSMSSYLNGRDSVILASFANSNKRIANLEDSLSLVNLSIQKELSRINQDQTELEKQSKTYTILLSVLILFILVLLIYNIIRNNKSTSSLSKLIGLKSTGDTNIDSQIVSCHNKLEGLQKEQAEILTEIKTIHIVQNDSKETNTTNAHKIDQIIGSLNEISAKINSLSALHVESVSETNLTKPDKVAYDAAVDAWININNHLSSLGKDRKKIPHVYALLAGETIEESELRADLSSLDEERKEEVNVIISDIRRFTSQHLNAIETWISFEAGAPKTLKDVVRFPLGKAFDQELDEELTGDFVNNGETIRIVAALGYLFPGSRNGCYREKSKVLV